MITVSPLGQEKVWFDKAAYDLAEKKYYEKLAKSKGSTSSPPRKERKNETSDNTTMNKCFLGLQMDGPGKVKPPEKVWADKHVYDLSEKEYYEKLEKLRLISLRKSHEIQEPFINEKPLEKTVIEIAGKGIDSDIAVDNKDTLSYKENATMEKELSEKDVSAKDTEKSADERITPVGELIQNKSSELIISPEKCVADFKSDIDSSRIQPDSFNDENKTKSFPAIQVENSALKDEEIIETQIGNPEQKLSSFITQTEPVEIVSPKKSIKVDKPEGIKENAKGQKNKSNEQNVNESVKEKRKPAEEKKSQDSFVKIDDIASITSSNVVIEVNNRINTLEKENSEMKQKVKELTDLLLKFEERLANIEKSTRPVDVCSKALPAQVSAQSSKQQYDDEDDGVDLFASDSEEENAETTKIKEQRLAEYAAKKSKKPALIAKSSIILDVKPWDDTTDMKLMEQEVRKITADGLLWGASKLVPLAYGIHKLQITCVVEDEKVSVDWLQETIEAVEDYVQSVDIAAFNKI